MTTFGFFVAGEADCLGDLPVAGFFVAEALVRELAKGDEMRRGEAGVRGDGSATSVACVVSAAMARAMAPIWLFFSRSSVSAFQKAGKRSW